MRHQSEQRLFGLVIGLDVEDIVDQGFRIDIPVFRGIINFLAAKPTCAMAMTLAKSECGL